MGGGGGRGRAATPGFGAQLCGWQQRRGLAAAPRADAHGDGDGHRGLGAAPQLAGSRQELAQQRDGAAAGRGGRGRETEMNELEQIHLRRVRAREETERHRYTHTET